MRLLKKNRMPLIAFVAAYDEYAVEAFDLNAVDYLLKPVNRARLRETVSQAQERLDRDDLRGEETVRVHAAAADYEAATRTGFMERLPIKRRDEIILVPVGQIASVIADGELLQVTPKRKTGTHSLTASRISKPAWTHSASYASAAGHSRMSR